MIFFLFLDDSTRLVPWCRRGPADGLGVSRGLGGKDGGCVLCAVPDTRALFSQTVRRFTHACTAPYAGRLMAVPLLFAADDVNLIV